MKRPIFIATISSVNGIIIGVYLHKSIPFVFVISLIMILLVYILKNRKSITRISKIIIIYLVFLNVFSLYTYKLDESYNNKYKRFNNEEIEIIGTIISDSNETDYKYTYEIKIDSINQNIKYRGDTLLLAIKKNNNSDRINYGEKIKLKGIYEEPSQSRNYKGFDYKFYLKTKKIYGSVLSEQKSIKVIKKKNLNVFNMINHSIKVKIRNNIRNLLSEKNANLELGLLLGDSDEIDEDIKNAFKCSSASHMIAISGQHMAYVILIVGCIFNKKIFGSNMSKTLDIITILFFIRLVGSSVSVIRAGITSIIYLISKLVHRKSDTITTLSLTLLLIITLNPFNIFNVGAQLSYAGTLSIILIYNFISTKADEIIFYKFHKNKLSKFIIENIFLTLSANVLIIPITIYHFNTISITFIFSNLILSPLIGAAIIVGFITVLTSFIPGAISKLPSYILNIILSIAIKVVEFFSKQKISKIYVVTPNLVIVILWYIIIFSVFYSIKNHKRVTAMIRRYKSVLKKIIILISIISLILKVIPSFTENLYIHFVDVGQGDCTLIITPQNKKIIIDGGGSTTDTYNIGESILVPYLLDRKINNIDYMIITHFDSDHCRRITYSCEETKG